MGFSFNSRLSMFVTLSDQNTPFPSSHFKGSLKPQNRTAYGGSIEEAVVHIKYSLARLWRSVLDSLKYGVFSTGSGIGATSVRMSNQNRSQGKSHCQLMLRRYHKGRLEWPGTQNPFLSTDLMKLDWWVLTSSRRLGPKNEMGHL
jgi:hypothetical protein